MTDREAINQILENNGIDPDLRLPTGASAFDFLEAAVIGALDELEDPEEIGAYEDDEPDVDELTEWHDFDPDC